MSLDRILAIGYDEQMKVKDLIKQLSEMDPELDVIMQKDAEGNGYSPCAGADNDAIYVAETTWSGEVWTPSWSAEDADMEEDEWDEFKQKHPRCVVLYPIN